MSDPPKTSRSLGLALTDLEIEVLRAMTVELGYNPDPPPDTIYVDWQVDSLFVNNEAAIAGASTEKEGPVGSVPGFGSVIVIDLVGNRWEVDSEGKVSRLGDGEPKEKYIAPLTVYLEENYYLTNPDKTKFSDGEIISVHYYMEGLTINVKDSSEKVMTLAEDHFPDSEGELWESGFNINIEELGVNTEKTFRILIPGVDTLEMEVIKTPFEEELTALEIAEFKEDVQVGIDDGESWNPNGYACNNAVRAFLYHRKDDAILFPETEPDKAETHRYGSGLSGPNDNTVLKGSITWSGLADNMYDDFTGEGNDLTGSFTEIEKSSIENWRHYFDRLQKEANKGEIVVGIVHSSDRIASRGHIVALVPQSVCEGTRRKLKNWNNQTEDVLLPCALEAGSEDKEIVWFRQSEDEINNYKWYIYDK